MRRVAWAVMLLAATGCLFEPAHEQTVASTAALIAFAGESGLAQGTVAIEAAPDPTGPFTRVATLPTTRTGAFAGSGRIPPALWRPVCGGGLETFVRGRLLPDGLLVTFDDAAIAGESGRACVARELADGNLVGAANACRSDASPVARIATLDQNGAVTELEGDLWIDDPKGVAALFCLRRIDGSLRVEDGVVADLALPALEQVSGDVTLVFDRVPGAASRAERIDLPRLAQIGGSLALSSPPPGEIADIDFGLPVLRALGGGLSIAVDAFNATPIVGLPALELVPGDFTYASDVSDSTGTGLLPALRVVEGDLVATFGRTTTQRFFPALEHVGGNAEVARGQWIPDTILPALARVDGGLRLTGISVLPFPAPTSLGALAEVGGTLDYDAMQTDVAFVGTAAVAVGGLRLNANAWLTDLDASLARFTIASTGPITLTDNPNLPECDALDWIAALAGYTGMATVAGNQPCP